MGRRRITEGSGNDYTLCFPLMGELYASRLMEGWREVITLDPPSLPGD